LKLSHKNANGRRRVSGGKGLGGDSITAPSVRVQPEKRFFRSNGLQIKQRQMSDEDAIK